jgi:hypothetical protein
VGLKAEVGGEGDPPDEDGRQDRRQGDDLSPLSPSPHRRCHWPMPQGSMRIVSVADTVR